MQIRSEALAAHLSKGLAPVYFLSGDETLLVEEAAEEVLGAARSQGFSERIVLHVEAGFDWNRLHAEGASLSLFAEKRIIDLRNPSGTLDKGAAEVLQAYCADPPEDTVLLIRSGRIEGRQKSRAWFKALDGIGVVVQLWPVSAGELPVWLKRRLDRAGIRLEADALTFLAERVEGNLLAAVQEIEKLRLAALSAPVTLEMLTTLLEDSAHYGVFDLLDAVLDGESGRVPRMLRGLRDEGVSLFAILGALTAQLRGLAEGRLPAFRRKQGERLLQRLGSAAVIDRVLAQCALVDQQGKGQLLGDAWLSLENLLLRLAGARLPSLEAQRPALTRP